MQLNLKKTQIKKKNKIFIKSLIGDFKIFFVNKFFKINDKLLIKIYKKKIIEFKNYDNNKSFFYFNKNIIYFLKRKNYLYLIFYKYNKSLYKLYDKILKIKIKGILQKFKEVLFLKGVGFKYLIKDNFLILKIGFSHTLNIKIPSNIKILNHFNKLILMSCDYNLLRNFLFFIRSKKIPEIYKGKGFIIKNENLLIKEGKKNKK